MKKFFFIPFFGTLGLVSALGVISFADDVLTYMSKKKGC